MDLSDNVLMGLMISSYLCGVQLQIVKFLASRAKINWGGRRAWLACNIPVNFRVIEKTNLSKTLCG